MFCNGNCPYCSVCYDLVTILVLLDYVLQLNKVKKVFFYHFKVTILVLLDYVLQCVFADKENNVYQVTILVLLDYVLQFMSSFRQLKEVIKCHNPCFIRLCFAIKVLHLHKKF